MPWNINSPKMTVFRLSCALTFIASVLFCTVTYINEIYRPPIVEGVGAATSATSAAMAGARLTPDVAEVAAVAAGQADAAAAASPQCLPVYRTTCAAEGVPNRITSTTSEICEDVKSSDDQPACTFSAADPSASPPTFSSCDAVDKVACAAADISGDATAAAAACAAASDNTVHPALGASGGCEYIVPGANSIGICIEAERQYSVPGDKRACEGVSDLSSSTACEQITRTCESVTGECPVGCTGSKLSESGPGPGQRPAIVAGRDISVDACVPVTMPSWFVQDHQGSGAADPPKACSFIAFPVDPFAVGSGMCSGNDNVVNEPDFQCPSGQSIIINAKSVKGRTAYICCDEDVMCSGNAIPIGGIDFIASDGTYQYDCGAPRSFGEGGEQIDIKPNTYKIRPTGPYGIKAPPCPVGACSSGEDKIRHRTCCIPETCEGADIKCEGSLTASTHQLKSTEVPSKNTCCPPVEYNVWITTQMEIIWNGLDLMGNWPWLGLPILVFFLGRVGRAFRSMS